MISKSYAAVMSGLLCASVLMAKDWWQSKPYAEWSKDEVRRMLDDSPWAHIYNRTVRPMRMTQGTSLESELSGERNSWDNVPFHLRFLTARPVRMAIAREMMLAQPNPEPAAWRDFVEKGDEENIIVVMDLGPVARGTSPSRAFWSSLQQLRTTNLTNSTYLAVASGKRVYLSRYDPPGEDGLGAKFYFPRKLRDGTLFATLADRKIRFHTSLIPPVVVLSDVAYSNGLPVLQEARMEAEKERTRIWVEFDLEQMIFDGKLEI